ncbi:CoA transferase subunit A [Saliterribacillus persicus]|uniref:Glutaconate CoA-transferase subunit A n=1 Tax=Saliterribacillus persicus TaxID=930114 RepID=A0A368XZF1_9BACI|nr:CoA-transferase [Saliterribacillus persicus]RCW71927.1 glutaconate CoA-transferase subunit A [Saliterribacillus persicus]
MSKQLTLQEAVSSVANGSRLALGGNVLHRAPMAFVRELTRQKKKDLKLVKTAGAHDIDLLCAVDAVSVVDAGFVSYETVYGLPPHYRNSVQTGKVKANEHACYTVISALRGASTNVPFMPVNGLKYGDLIDKNDYFLVVEDPFTKEPVTLVRSIFPDVAIIHVHACDEEGNAIIEGPKYEDILMSRAAERVIITTEQILPSHAMKQYKDRIDIPGFLVSNIVKAPNGAKPTACYKKYDVDEKALRSFLKFKTQDEIYQWVDQYSNSDHSGKRRTFA